MLATPKHATKARCSPCQSQKTCGKTCSRGNFNEKCLTTTWSMNSVTNISNHWCGESAESRIISYMNFFNVSSNQSAIPLCFCAKPSSPMVFSTLRSACNVRKPEGCVSHRNGMVSDAVTVIKKVTYKVPIVLSHNNGNSNKNCRFSLYQQNSPRELCKIQTIAGSFLRQAGVSETTQKKSRHCINASCIKPCFTEKSFWIASASWKLAKVDQTLTPHTR